MYRINKDTKKDLFTQVAQIILDNMMERLPEYDIGITIVRNDRSSYVRYGNNEIQVSVGVAQLDQPIWSRYYKSRFETFLKGIDVNFNKYSLFTLIILHEFGHIFHTLLAGDSDYCKKIDFVNLSLTGIFGINPYEDDTHNSERRCSIFPAELFADKFAYENFYPIWKECLSGTLA